MNIEDFEVKIKEMLKGYFPSAEMVYAENIDTEGAVCFGLTENRQESEKATVDGYSFYVYRDGNDRDECIEAVMESVSVLRFFKEPKFIFWRSIILDSAHNFTAGRNTHKAGVRFYLGYSK